MSLGTGIEWTDATWNPVRGCSRVSQGCVNCYAERIAARFSKPGQAFHGFAQWRSDASRLEHAHRGIDDADPHWTGRVEFIQEKLAEPLRWRKPQRIFVNSMSDLFHEKLSDHEIAAVFGVMALATWHHFQILTKRAERMPVWFGQTRPSECIAAAYATQPEIARHWRLAARADLHLPAPADRWPLPNVHLGVSVENQKDGSPRIDLLRQTPAAVRMLSIEPLLEDLGQLDLSGIGWVIVGGESGPGARPTKPSWVRDIRDQCVAASVPFFFKQWGGRDKKRAGRMLDGRTWDEMPKGVADEAV